MPANRRLSYRHTALGLVAVLLFVLAGPVRVWLTSGDKIGSRSLQLSDPRAASTAKYILSFDGQSAGTVGSVRAQFCANSPLIGQPCTAPTGFDLSGASLSAQSGMTGFVIAPESTANVLVLTRAPAPSVVGVASYTLDGVVNPAQEGSYFVRLETFASTDASGANNDYGGLVFAIDNALSVSATVPPYLLFCAATTMPDFSCDNATGDYIDFGELSRARTISGQTKLLVATNGANGYAIRAFGTTLTSGNNEIPALASNDFSRLGASQFGLNLVGNGMPAVGSSAQGPGLGAAAGGYGTPDSFRFVSGDIVAAAPNADDFRRYTASYIVNISKDQPAGVYVSTITYIGLANF